MLDPLRALRTLRRKGRERPMAGPRLLRAFAEAYPEAVFAEIGGNDGEQHDLLRPLILSRYWRGVIAEPVPFVFERLVRNYGGHRGLALENVAIAAENGNRLFYHLAESPDPTAEGLPSWYDGIGSFSRTAVLSHEQFIPDIEARLVEIQVPCLTLPALCERAGIERLDLLLIDTEGYDWEIIRHLDLSVLRPRLLVYEHYHLSPADRHDADERVRSAGYETMEEHFDTFCLDTAPADDLTAGWRRLEPAVPGVAAYEERG